MKNVQEMSQQELLASLFVIWGMHDIEKDNKQTFITDEESDIIAKIIYYRTKHLGVKIPTELGYIISLCSAGNPGIAIIMYHTLLSTIKEAKGKIPRGYTITVEDFSNAFPVSFPDTTIPEHNENFQKLWDGQKDEKGNNKVDTYKFWDDLFEEE